MGLFSRLKTAMGGSGPEPADDGLEAVRKEMRMHTRYAVAFHQNAHFQLGDDWSGRVMDISYGGVAVKFTATKPGTSLPLEGNGVITILGAGQKFSVKAVRTVPHDQSTIYVGLCFNHTDPETLMYLREIIEPMRQGLTMDSITREVRSEKYRGEDWCCFRGEGPVDLVFRLDSGNQLAEGLATFKIADYYYEIAIQNGILRTAKSAEKSSRALAVGAKMIPTAKPDPTVLRRAFLILASAPAPVAEKSAPFLKAIEQAFRETEKGAA
jgi:hypothetical protein